MKIRKIIIICFFILFVCLSIFSQSSPIYGVWSEGWFKNAKHSYAITDTEFKYRNNETKVQTIYSYTLNDDTIVLYKPTYNLSSRNPIIPQMKFRYERKGDFLTLYFDSGNVNCVLNDKINMVKDNLRKWGGIVLGCGIVIYAIGLSGEEQAICDQYMKNSDPFNKYLRDGIKQTNETQIDIAKQCKILENAINKQKPLTKKQVVTRFANGNLCGQNLTEINGKLNIKKGNILTEKSFLSTTTAPTQTMRDIFTSGSGIPYEVEITLPKGTRGIFFGNRSHDIYNYIEESEMLLSHPTLRIIKDPQFINGIWKIFAEVVL